MDERTAITPLRVLVFIVAYNAEAHISAVLDRIPESFYRDTRYQIDVLIIDDASQDGTAHIAQQSGHKAVILCNPINQGYGGNQKLGYAYAIREGYDAVALLHGDGQYDPACLPALLEPILRNGADAVFGSRMLRKGDALKGGMPLYKFAGNMALTWLQNRLLRTQLSEFHSGYRVYRVDALKRLPFERNSNDFDFDTDIIIQLVDNGCHIHEVPIPTYYGDEICYVNGPKYALKIIASTLSSRLQRLRLYYHPRFDYSQAGEEKYADKLGFSSSHSFAVTHVPDNAHVADFGSGGGSPARHLLGKNCHIDCYGRQVFATDDERLRSYAVDLDKPVATHIRSTQVQGLLLLDILEHLARPEQLLEELRSIFSYADPKVIISVPNVAFLSVRLGMLMGKFNYKPSGIMDKTHLRFFTRASFRSLLERSGYYIMEVHGIPAPFPLLHNGRLAMLALRINELLIRIFPGLFSYQIGYVARMNPTLDALLENR